MGAFDVAAFDAASFDTVDVTAALKRQTFDNFAEGATITAAGSGSSGDAITVGGTAPTALAAAAARGARGARCTGAAATSFVGLAYNAGQTAVTAQVAFRVDVAPSVATDIMVIRNSTGNMVNARLSVGNVLTVADAGGTTRYTSPTLTAGWYWLTIGAAAGSTTGQVVAYLRTDSDTVVSMGADPGAVCNTGTAEPVVARFGKNTSAGSDAFDIDEPAVAENTLAEMDRPAGFSDDFTRADSATLGASWLGYTTAFGVVSNQAAPATIGATASFPAVTTTTDDQAAEVTLSALGGNSMGIVLNAPTTIGADDTTTGAFYLFRHNGTAWGILKKTAQTATYTTLASVTAGLAAGARMRAERVGSTLNLYVGGTLALTATDATPITGQRRAGIRTNNSTAVRFDDFKLYPATVADGASGLSGSGSVAAAISIDADGAVAGAQSASTATTTNITATGAISLSGAATVTETVTLTATGAVVVGLPAPVAETVTLTAAGQVAGSKAATVAETASITAAGFVASFGAASSAVTSTLTAAGSVGTSRPATVAPAVTITAAGFVTIGQPATVTETTAVTATGQLGTSQPAAVAESVTVTAAGAVTTGAVAPVAETVTVTAAGVVATSRAATVTETVSVSAAGVVSATRAATVSETTTITAAGVVAGTRTATVSESVTITAAGSVGVNVPGTATRVTTASITATGALGTTAGAATSSSVTIITTGRLGTAGVAARDTTTTVTASGTVARSTGAPVTLAATITADGAAGYTLGATRTALVTVTAAGVVFEASSPTPDSRLENEPAEDRYDVEPIEDRFDTEPVVDRYDTEPPEDRYDNEPAESRILEVIA